MKVKMHTKYRRKKTLLISVLIKAHANVLQEFFSTKQELFFLDEFYQFILLVFVCFVLKMHKFIKIINKNALKNNWDIIKYKNLQQIENASQCKVAQLSFTPSTNLFCIIIQCLHACTAKIYFWCNQDNDPALLNGPPQQHLQYMLDCPISNNLLCGSGSANKRKFAAC